jgi:molybdopterin biosynthesis enzyme
MIMLIAGASASSEDFTPALTEELGELLFHGITVMSGKLNTSTKCLTFLSICSRFSRYEG